MPASDLTDELELSQFQDTDKPTWRGDYNGDMGKIDLAVKTLRGHVDNLLSLDIDVHEYGAVGDGVTDDTAAIQAAIDHAVTLNGARVVHRPLTYRIAGTLTVQSGVILAGKGMIHPSGNSGTTYKLTAAGSKVWVRGTGSGIRDIAVDGNSVALIPLQVGGTGAGDFGSDNYFENVQVTAGVTRNWTILQTQNAAFINCRSNATAAGSGEGVLIDNGVGGCLFLRFECNSAQNGPNMRIGPTTTTSGFPTSTNTFLACQWEYRATDGPELKIEGGFTNTFIGCASYHPTAAHTSPVVEISGNTRTIFMGLTVGANADKLRSGIKVGPGSSGLNRSVLIAANIRGFGVAEIFDVNYANALVLMNGPVTGLNPDEGTGINLKTAATPAINIGQDNQWQTSYRLLVATDTAIATSLIGEFFSRFLIDTSGKHRWGAGASNVFDVELYRAAAGVMGITGGLRTSTYIASNIFTTVGRPSAATCGIGAMIYDNTLKKPIWSDGANWTDATGAVV